MVSGAVALPSAGSPGDSARRTTSGGSSSPAAVVSPPSATAAKARAQAMATASSVLAAGALMPLFARFLIAPFVVLFLALHRMLRMVGLAHRLGGGHALNAEGARARCAGERRGGPPGGGWFRPR